MALQIPFPNQFADFKQDVLLDDIAYRFRIRYNTRADSWHLTVADLDDVVLIAGIKLVENWELLTDFPDRGLPVGVLMVIKTVPEPEEPRPDRDNIGQDPDGNEFPFQLLYLTEAEVAEIDAEVAEEAA